LAFYKRYRLACATHGNDHSAHADYCANIVARITKRRTDANKYYDRSAGNNANSYCTSAAHTNDHRSNTAATPANWPANANNFRTCSTGLHTNSCSVGAAHINDHRPNIFARPSNCCADAHINNEPASISAYFKSRRPDFNAYRSGDDYLPDLHR
jgi:hypothetical protein